MYSHEWIFADTYRLLLTLTDNTWYLMTITDNYWWLLDTYWHFLTITDTNTSLTLTANYWHLPTLADYLLTLSDHLLTLETIYLTLWTYDPTKKIAKPISARILRALKICVRKVQNMICKKVFTEILNLFIEL